MDLLQSIVDILGIQIMKVQKQDIIDGVAMLNLKVIIYMLIICNQKKNNIL